MSRLGGATDWCCAMQEAEEGQDSLAVPQVPVLALPGMPGADQVSCQVSCVLSSLPSHVHTLHCLWNRKHSVKAERCWSRSRYLAHRLALLCRRQGAAMSRVWPASSIRKLCRARSHLPWTSCSTWRTCRLCWQAPPQQVLRSISALPPAKSLRLFSEYAVFLTLCMQESELQMCDRSYRPCRIPI